MDSEEQSAIIDQQMSASVNKSKQYTKLLLVSDYFLSVHKYTKVEEPLLQATKLCPELAVGHAKLGEFHLRYGDIPSAKEHLETARRLDPLDVQNLVNLCAYYELMGPPEETKQVAEEILALEPTNVQALVVLGCHYSIEGQQAKALVFLQKATTLEPTNDTIWYNLSLVYHKQGNLQEEMKCLTNAIGRNPFCAEYWCQLGFCHKSLVEYDESLDCLWQANRAVMYDPSIVFEIAVVYALKKNKEMTLETLRLAKDEDFPLCEEILKEEAFTFLKSDRDFQLLLASLSN